MLPSTMRRSFLRPQPFASRYALATRHFQTSPQRPFPTKYDQDKDSMNVESNEYSKSGGDEAAAATEKAAFDPSKTSPEEEHETARQESGGNANNPLNVSPANHDVSMTQADKQRGDPQGSAAETGGGGGRSSTTSGAGSSPKSGGGKSGGGGSG